MKKIYIILEDSTEIFVGMAESIYEWILAIHDMVIVPFHGNKNYNIVKNVYNEGYDQYVTYKAEKV